MAAKKLKKYLAPKWTSYGGVIVFGFFLLISIPLWVNDGNRWTFCIFAVLLVIALMVPLGKMLATSLRIRKEQKAGNLETLLNDFENGQVFCSDAVRLGENYIIGRNTGRFFRYENIRKIWQYIHKTNFVVDKIQIRIEKKDGITEILCHLKTGKRNANDDASELLTAILQKNPKIQIGYQ